MRIILITAMPAMPDDVLPLMAAFTPATDEHAHATLADLPRGSRAIVRCIRAAVGPESEQLTRRLQEIGFVEGEALRVVAHGFPGGDPIAVRIGGTSFALRRFEAQCVLVTTAKRDPIA